MKQNELVGNFLLRRGNFYTFIKQKTHQCSYPLDEINIKFVEILNKVCYNYTNIVKLVKDPRSVISSDCNQFNMLKFEKILKEAIKIELESFPETWNNLEIYQIAAKLVDEANRALKDYLLKDSFRPGSMFLDMQGKNTNLLISCGEGQLYKIPAQKESILQYLQNNYQSEIKQGGIPTVFKSYQSEDVVNVDRKTIVDILEDYGWIADDVNPNKSLIEKKQKIY